MPYLCRMPTLRAKAAGGTNSGIPQAVIMAGLHMSHNGRQRLSPNVPATVQARQGQQKKP